MSKLEVLEYKDTLLEQHKWLRDLVSHYSNAVNLELYIAETLKKLAEKFPQTQMNGDKNIWLMKPGQSHGGDDITLHTEEETLLEAKNDYKSRFPEIGLRWEALAQKCVENPLMFKSRKMDLRIWILITDFNPLTVWFYEDFRMRIALEKYDESS